MAETMRNRVAVPLSIAAIAMVAVVIAAALAMLFLRLSRVGYMTLFASEVLNHELSYQLLTLALAGALIGIAFLLGGRGTLVYLKPTTLSGEIIPVRWMGIRPKEGESWRHLGTNFLVVITIVTGSVIFLQVVRGGAFRFSFSGVFLPALLFAALNSFTEEVIFRHTITSVFLENGRSASAAALTSAVVFGGIHYFGAPGGIPGIVLAGFLGWFLSKSIAETHSFAWAWIIHFVQDVLIFTALFGTMV